MRWAFPGRKDARRGALGGAGGAPGTRDWPRGATSDDTEQLLLVAEYLVEANGQVDERDFLGRLANALPGMGAGPTTQAAVRRFVATGELATEGSSIGAAMRALPFGWATPVTAAGHRRELTMRLSRTTHGAPEATSAPAWSPRWPPGPSSSIRSTL